LFSSYILYVKMSCPFCTRAIRELQERGFEYKIVEVDDCPSEFVTQLKDAYEHDTFPMILGYDEDYRSYSWIGGCSDLIESFDD